MLKKLPYPYPSEQRMEILASQPYPVWLDSPGKNGFEIMCCSPERVIKQQRSKHTNPNMSELLIEHRDGSVVKQDGNALDYLESQLEVQIEQQNAIPKLISPVEQQLPFTGGWIGLVNYEYGEQLPGLQSKHYRKKNRHYPEELVFARYDWAIIIDHKQQKSWLYCDAPIANNHPALLEPDKTRSPEFKLLESFKASTAKQHYMQDITNTQAYLDQGDCYQINYSQRFDSEFSGSPFAAYCLLRNKMLAPFSCYFDWGSASLLSFSPERFIQLKNRQLLTEPIKGTSPRFDNPIEDTQSRYRLKNSVKDQSENLMIVDLLRNDLSRIAEPGTVKVDELFGLYSFSNVHHLISRITAKLRVDKSPVDIIRHCFPGGSITGAPKKRAMEIINELEPHARECYCGSMFVFSDNGRTDSNILIRTVLCTDEQVFCYAGGGIVTDSAAESEYQECFNKINAIIEALESTLSDNEKPDDKKLEAQVPD